MKNILVTGANGQLGNEMRVLSTEYKAVSYTHLTLPTIRLV